jgi:NAD(P)-dependent dehydrogenase (short-subunit alcohol dehydrogenase family)
MENDPFCIKGKVIAIIGATGILGEEYVRFLHSKDAQVIIGDIDIKKANDLAANLTGNSVNCMPLYIDVTKEESIVSFYDQIFAKFGKLDVVLNNVYAKPDNFYAPF